MTSARPTLNDFVVRSTRAVLDVVSVPGALEIPLALQTLALERRGFAGRRYDALVALGCVVRGETTHYDYICAESARGLMDLSIREGYAIGYGILTVENITQAQVRAALDQGDKGGEAMRACVAMIALKRSLNEAAR
mgnify:CR=1 FL=1